MSACVAFLVVASVSFGKTPPPRQQAQVQLLDQAAFLCDNCFFGASDYFYCFANDDMVLIGYQRTPVVNWWDKTKNYATKLHPSWTVLDAPTEKVPISYDGEHIWVNRADQEAVQKAGGRLHAVLKERKDVRLIRDSTRDVFTNKRCQDAVRAKAH
jgi:hypothetical protein